MKNLIIHIPHSSLKIPKMFYKKSLLSFREIEIENYQLCDLLTDKFITNKNCYQIVFPYSRIFCDVEKFKDDSMEVMSKIGMGVIYTKGISGNTLIDVDDEYKRKIIKNYYDKYHRSLDSLLSKILKKNKMCYIIDLHSFSDYQAEKTLNLSDCPDICIGIDDDFNDPIISQYVEEFFTRCGYSVRVNYPYTGSFVPNNAYQNKFINVKSIMFEINKRVYLNDDLSVNSEAFNKLKNELNILVQDILRRISQNQ